MAETPFDYKIISQFEVREDDVYLLTYPKSGTTWFKEILPCVLSGGNIDAIKGIPPDAKVPYLELVLSDTELNKKLKEALLVSRDFDIDKMTAPRILSSHLYYEQLPKQVETKKAKVIYIARNPKDVAVSNYHHLKVLPFHSDMNTFDEYLDNFYEGKYDFYNITWKTHVMQTWERKHMDNVLFIKYEDVRKDFNGTITKLSEFLGVKLDKAAIQRIADHCNIENMRRNPLARKANFLENFKIDPGANPFVRKGKVGGWKDVFTVAQNERFDKVYEKWMEGSDLHFEFE